MQRMKQGRSLMFVASLAVIAVAGERAHAASFPGPDALPELSGLPDPLLKSDGAAITSPEQWPARRAEILEMLLHYQYGHMPPLPETIGVEEAVSETVFDGAARKMRCTLVFGPGNALRMPVAYYTPASKPGPFPVILAIEPVWDAEFDDVARRMTERGFLFAGYDQHALDADDENRADGAHPLYPEHDWATLAVWAWGARVTVSHLLTLPPVDARHVALTGHSRRGKTTLLAAAMDERITLAAPHCSGCGGAGSYRILGEKCETLDAITSPKRFHYWFQPRLREFLGKENRLPFDQHYLKALIAPRPLVSMEGLEDHWANPLGTQQSWRAAQPVFDLLGAGANNVLYFREGGHPTTDDDWDALMDFCDHFFRGKALSRPFNVPPFPDTPPPVVTPAPL